MKKLISYSLRTIKVIYLHWKGAFWLPFLFVFLSHLSFSQINLSGKSGLLYIPNASKNEVGDFRVGYNYNPVDYALYRNGKNAENIFYANLALLSRFEITLSILSLRDSRGDKVSQGLGDRQLDVKYLVSKEKGIIPSVAIVLSTPFTIDASMLTHVIVATKHFNVDNNFQLETTVGYGSPYFLYRAEDNLNNSNIFSNFKWQKKSEYKHSNSYLVGPFGGIKLDFQKKAGIMAEWDSQKLNIGAYGIIGKRWTVQAGLLNFDQVMFGSSFAVDLFRPTRKIEKLYE